MDSLKCGKRWQFFPFEIFSFFDDSYHEQNLFNLIVDLGILVRKETFDEISELGAIPTKHFVWGDV